MALSRDALFWDSFTQLAKKSVDAAILLEKMFEDLANSAKTAEQIKLLETEGDTITHEVVKTLHQTWITPLDREEIHGLISGLDDVLDSIDGAAARVALYEIKETNLEAKELAQVLVASTKQVAAAVESIKNIKDAEAILAICRDIAAKEDEADAVFRRGLVRLFKEVKDPLEVMKWRDIYERMETATDRAEDVANIVEGIVLEHG